jgi:hypothetical protein
MDYTVIAQKNGAGRSIEGMFEAVKRDDHRIGTRGWWGGSSMMSEAAAQREVERRNAGQSKANPPTSSVLAVEQARGPQRVPYVPKARRTRA